jgi:hypothetical protein
MAPVTQPLPYWLQTVTEFARFEGRASPAAGSSDVAAAAKRKIATIPDVRIGLASIVAPARAPALREHNRRAAWTAFASS